MSNKDILTNELDSLIDYLTNFDKIGNNRNAKHLGVLSGISGVLLVLIDILKNTPTQEIKDKIEYVFDKIIEILESSESLMFSYCDGLAGFGILLVKIKKLNIFDFNQERTIFIDDLLDQIDEITSEELEGLFLQENFDFLHGALGLGFYFLERNNVEDVKRVVEYLSKKATINDSESYWVKYDKYQHYTSVIDMGVAHGNTSIILFLTKVLHHFDFENVKELIYGNIQFYIRNKQDLGGEIISFYPTALIHSKYKDNTIVPTNSRLAWCYGDLGALYLLFIISKELGFYEEEKLFLSQLRFVANRTTKSDSYKIDAAFCHGSSGIAVIFKNLSLLTDDRIFKDAANYWLNITLASKDAESNKIDYIGYSFPIENSTEHNISLLEGVTGLLYCYSKFLNYDTSLTDEFLLLKM